MAGAEKGWAMVLVARSDDGVIVNTTVPLEDAFLLTFIGSDILKVAAYSNDETVH